jgi:hypothetical protein
MILIFFLHNFYFERDILFFKSLPWITGTYSSIERIIAYIFSNLSYFGGATIFPLFFVWPFIKKRNFMIMWGAILIISIAVSLILYFLSQSFLSGQYSISELFLFTLFLSSSLFFIFLISNNIFNVAIKKLIRKKNSIFLYCDHIFLGLWFFGILLINSFMVGGAARYNTLFTPILVIYYFLLIFNHISKKRINHFLIIVFISTFFLGVLLSYADYQYAQTYKKFVDSFQKRYNAKEVWFLGHHGYQYYMEKKGYIPLPANNDTPKKGDLIVKAGIPSPRKIIPELKKRMTLIEEVEYNSKYPIRIHNPESHAGFYTYGAGFLPFSISNTPLEKFKIYIVNDTSQ